MGSLATFVKDKQIAKRQTFEKDLLREDVVEYFASKSKEELEDEYGMEVARMVGFEQKNAHHCYDLWFHTLHTVESLDTTGMSDKDAVMLKVAAFFHDIGKPEVVGYNPKTGQQNFIDHAVHSVDVAKDILGKMGYSQEEINRISFFIAHHDDFISYNSDINQDTNHHTFIRGITPSTVKEMIIQNQINWNKIGMPCHLPTRTGDEETNKKNLLHNQTNNTKRKFICSYLANDVEPTFVNYYKKPIKVDVDMEDITKKVQSGKFAPEYVPTEEDYRLLLEICKADARAQSKEIQMTDPKTGETYIADSRERKVKTMEQIGSYMKEAYKDGMQLLDSKKNDILENETFDFKSPQENNCISI